MKKILFLMSLTLLICLPVKALIYKYTIKTSPNKIRMEIEHSRRKEIILFDFNQATNLRNQLNDKQPFFVDEFNRLIESLTKYQNIGCKESTCSFFKPTDKTIINVYNNLKEINNILEKIGASIIIKEKYSTSKQAQNILSDPMIYIPQLVCGSFFAYWRSKPYDFSLLGSEIIQRKNSLLTRFGNSSKAFFIGTTLGFFYPPQCIIANGFSALIAYIRHK